MDYKKSIVGIVAATVGLVVSIIGIVPLIMFNLEKPAVAVTGVVLLLKA